MTLVARGMSIGLKREALMKALAASFVVVLLGCGPAVHKNGAERLPPGTFLITAE